MIFSTQPYGSTEIDNSFLKILNKLISEVVEFKYLSALVTYNLSWESHKQQFLNKLPACYSTSYKSRDY